jgi:S1-C subfamily serine protease
MEVTMKKYFRPIFILILAAQLALTGCSSLTLPIHSAVIGSSTANAAIETAPAATTSRLVQTAASPTSLTEIETALENIYTRVNPSVVNIQVTQKQEVSQSTIPDFPFRFFFEPDLPQTQPQQPQEFYQHGAGSGFVWDKQGDIVTNNHVVAGADKIDVVFDDGTTVPATVVGVDPDSDLAVIKVDVAADWLHPVTLADSGQVKVGQMAIAIGNPFGLEGTMTVGIVSALGRSLPTTSGDTEGTLSQGPTFTIPEIIQTDAPINPGNSGGVLVNDQGQVIGVTAAIESPVRASAGIGFAIPAGIVDRVVPSLISDGRYQHPWLGLSGMSLTPELARAMDLDLDQRGALVIEVTPDGPADKAGLHGSDRQIKIEGQAARVGGDVITAIDGKPVNDFEDVVGYLVGSTNVGQEVSLTVLRQGKEQQLKATLGGRPQPEGQPGQTEGSTVGEAWLGVQGITLTPEIAQATGLSAGQEGVLVEQIELGSPADEAGLRGSYKPTIIAGHRLMVGGDVIIDVDGQPVRQMETLQTFIQQAKPGQEITLTLLRDGKQLEMPLTLSERAS